MIHNNPPYGNENLKMFGSTVCVTCAQVLGQESLTSTTLRTLGLLTGKGLLRYTRLLTI